QVRRVTAINHMPDSDTLQVGYIVVAGPDRRRAGIVDAQTFAGWAKYEVFLNENSWQRVKYGDTSS
ncbi:MAG: hypothetical protein WCZ87_04070, partial [Thiohalobacteraceae bacterium]